MIKHRYPLRDPHPAFPLCVHAFSLGSSLTLTYTLGSQLSIPSPKLFTWMFCFQNKNWSSHCKKNKNKTLFYFLALILWLSKFLLLILYGIAIMFLVFRALSILMQLRLGPLQNPGLHPLPRPPFPNHHSMCSLFIFLSFCSIYFFLYFRKVIHCLFCSNRTLFLQPFLYPNFCYYTPWVSKRF